VGDAVAARRRDPTAPVSVSTRSDQRSSGRSGTATVGSGCRVVRWGENLCSVAHGCWPNELARGQDGTHSARSASLGVHAATNLGTLRSDCFDTTLALAYWEIWPAGRAVQMPGGGRADRAALLHWAGPASSFPFNQSNSQILSKASNLPIQKQGLPVSHNFPNLEY
jgi:hypothetical protein